MTTNPRSFRHASLAAVLGLLVVTALVPLPVRAASSVTIDARALLGGRYQAGGWAALAVTLVNPGAPTAGHLVAEGEAGTVRRAVEMPAGARKVVTLYVQPGGFQRQLSVRYEEPNGTVQATVDVRAIEPASAQVAIVGDGGGTLRPQIVTATDQGAADPLALSVGDLPERPEPLAGLSTLIWAADAGALNEDQRRSIERWVADGGQLVIIGGPDWQARTAGLDELLPLDGLAAVDGVDQRPLATWAGSDEPLPAVTVSTGTLRDGARALATTDGGDPLAAWQAVGAGRVVLFGADLAHETYRTWAGAPLLWARILESGTALDEFFGRFPDPIAAASSMARALDTLPSLDLPPVELLLAIIVAYIALIGPISYAVLRRIDRRELAWVTAPVLVIVFSAISYGTGIALRGTDVIVNQIAVLRSAPMGSTASVETYAGIFSPDRATYDVVVDADALVGSLPTYEALDGAVGGARLVAEQGRPARLHDLSITVGGYEYVRADAVLPHAAPLEVTWSHRGDAIVGRVTNVGAEPLTDVAFISDSGGELVGDLEPGASAEFTLDRSSVNQSSASDQVYGFAGFSSTDPDRRRIAARRGVIDALVSYGGWAPVDLGFTGYGGRGPYLIGWRTGDGPMPITLDGVEARRYGEIVEVVAVRPGIGQDEVSIGPGEMAVTVAPEGGAVLVGRSTVALGAEPGASATFTVALPLEVSGLTPTEVEIVVGLDPSMVIEEGFFPGHWPGGYTVEIRDPRTGEWMALGDLSEGNRYAIEDPAGALDDSGRMIVRVTAAEPDPNFGDPSVFVSANVSGVLSP